MDRMIGRPHEFTGDVERTARLAQHRARLAEHEPRGILDGPEHVILGDRQEGKTFHALRWLTEPGARPRVLIVRDDHTAQHLRFVLDLPANDARIVSYRHLLNIGVRDDVEYGIDETVAILEQLLGLRRPLRLMTIATAADHQV